MTEQVRQILEICTLYSIILTYLTAVRPPIIVLHANAFVVSGAKTLSSNHAGVSKVHAQSEIVVSGPKHHLNHPLALLWRA